MRAQADEGARDELCAGWLEVRMIDERDACTSRTQAPQDRRWSRMPTTWTGIRTVSLINNDGDVEEALLRLLL